jgi:hypothetical protein
MVAAGAEGHKLKALILGLCARQRSIQPYPVKGDPAIEAGHPSAFSQQ